MTTLFLLPMAIQSFGKLAMETPKSSLGNAGFKCVSLKTVGVFTDLLAQHGPSASENPGITFIVLDWTVVFVLFSLLEALLTTILYSAVGLKRLSVLLDVLFDTPLLTIRSKSAGDDMYVIFRDAALWLRGESLRFGHQRKCSTLAALSRILRLRLGGGLGSILTPSLEASKYIPPSFQTLTIPR